MEKKKKLTFMISLLVVLTSFVYAGIDNYVPTSTTPSETEPYDTVFFLNWTDADDDGWNITWYVNATPVEIHEVFVSEDYFTFDGNFSSAGDWNVTAGIFDNSEQAETNFSWILTISDATAVSMVENVNYTLDDDIMQVNWTFKNESVSDSSTPFLYLNGTEVRGGYWDLVWQKNIPTPNGSYLLYATDVYVEKNGTILITNFNEGDVLWYDQDLNYLDMREFGYDKQPETYLSGGSEPKKFWSYGNNCTINNSMISLQSLMKWYLPEAGALDPFYAQPLYQFTLNTTKGTSSDCDDALSCNNDTTFTLAISTNWTSIEDLDMYPKIPEADRPELNASSRESGLYGGSYMQGNLGFFGASWKHKRYPSIIVWGANYGTPEYTICKYTFTDVVYCFDESTWNYSVGSPRDMTIRDDDIFMVYNVESGGVNYAYTGYYDYYGGEFSDNMHDTALLQNLGCDIEVWGMYYTNGYLYIVASNPDNSNNTIYKYTWTYDLSDLEYLDGSSVSAQDNDNITLEILGDEGNAKGDVEILSFLYGAPAGNTAPSISSHSPESLSFSIEEPNNQEFLMNWSDSENATVIVTWYQDGVLKNTNTTSSQDVSWTFSGNYTSAGEYNITVIISDGEFNDSLNWTMTITDTNREPSIILFLPSNLIFAIAEPNSQIFYVNWTDPENSTILYYWYKNNNKVSSGSTSNDQISYTFSGSYATAGVYNITSIISDGEFNESINWTMTVTDTEEDAGGDASFRWRAQEDEEEETTEKEDIDIVTGGLFATIGIGEEAKTDIQIDSLSKEFRVLPGTQKEASIKLYNTQNTEVEVILEVTNTRIEKEKVEEHRSTVEIWESLTQEERDEYIASGDTDFERGYRIVTNTVEDGNASDWISFDTHTKKTIKIQPYDDVTINYNLDVPKDANPGKYKTYIMIESEDNVATYNISIHVLKEEVKLIVLGIVVFGAIAVLTGLFFMIFGRE